MSLHWLRDRARLKQIKVKYKSGDKIPADYFTKHHSINHHRTTRPKFIKDQMNMLVSNLSDIYNDTHMGLQGCINTPHVGLNYQHVKD